MNNPDEGGETQDNIPEGRDAAESAWDSVAAGTGGTEPTPPPAEATPAEQVAVQDNNQPKTDQLISVEDQAAAARVRDEHGRFKKGEAQKLAKAEPVKPTAPVIAGEPLKPVEPKPPTPEPLKPPGGWAPQAREKWASVPAEVQQEVHRRERDMATTLQRQAGVARVGQAFQQVMAPFEGMIRAEGGDALAAVDSVMRTAAALRTAPPAHKAKLLATMVRTFGVPIDALDAELAGQAAPPGAGGAQGFDPQQFEQQLFQKWDARNQQQRQQSQAARAQAEVEAVSSKLEFFDDVRDDMGDLMELAARRGKVLTTEQAYEAALRAPHHSGILDIVNQRKAAETAKTAQAQADKARAAGSSVRGQPTSAPQGTQNGAFKEPRDAALAAWEQHAAG